MLRVTHEQERTSWYFEPKIVVNQQIFIPKPEPNAFLDSINSPFAPIPLAKGKDTSQIIMFQPRKNDSFPLGRLMVGKYSINVLSRINQGHHFKKVCNFKVDFSKEVLQNLGITKLCPRAKGLCPEIRDKLCGSA